MRRMLLLMALFGAVNLEAQNTLTNTVIQRYYNGIRRNLEASAEAMPAEKYNFKLTEGQNTFGWWLLHAAGRNFQDCAAIKGEMPPHTEAQLMASLKEKSEISKALKDSFAYCSMVFEGLDDAKVLASQQTTFSFLHTVVHNSEAYGNVVGYLRASGIVPPSTAGRGPGR